MVSVPAPPSTWSEDVIVAASPMNVSLLAVPVRVSAPVVSDLIIGFDKLLIFKDFFMILLDIKNIAYRVPILNSKSP